MSPPLNLFPNDALHHDAVLAAREVVFWRKLAREQLQQRDPSRLNASSCMARSRQAERRVIARADRIIWELEPTP